MPAATLAALVLCATPVAVDGDTMHCAGLKPAIRITGIDSPEMPGHCRKTRVCAPGDPFKAKAALVALLASGPVYYRPLKTDLYGRTIAVVYANGTNVSCVQLANANAIYKPTWDEKHIIRTECGL